MLIPFLPTQIRLILRVGEIYLSYWKIVSDSEIRIFQPCPVEVLFVTSIFSSEYRLYITRIHCHYRIICWITPVTVTACFTICIPFFCADRDYFACNLSSLLDLWLVIETVQTEIFPRIAETTAYYLTFLEVRVSPRFANSNIPIDRDR
jgi:hypothetical protein